jgi:hypothetical protein
MRGAKKKEELRCDPKATPGLVCILCGGGGEDIQHALGGVSSLEAAVSTTSPVHKGDRPIMSELVLIVLQRLGRSL